MAKKPRLYSVKEISVRTKINPTRVRKHIKHGELEASKIGGHYYVTKDKFKEFVEDNHKGESLFGVIAIEKGFVSFDDVFSALTTQRFNDSRWLIHKPLGEILCDRGNMTVEEVKVVLEEQQNAVIVG